MKNSGALWAVAGAAITAVLLPTAASAVTSQLVSLVDQSNGFKVAVDSAHRLRVAETAPANIVTIAGTVNSPCTALYTVPTGRTLIIKNISLTSPTTSNNSEISVFGEGTCTAPSLAQGLVFETAGGAHDTQIDLGPGAVVKGGQIVAAKTNNVAADIHIYGYLTP
jgi:hypothetical protein